MYVSKFSKQIKKFNDKTELINKQSTSLEQLKFLDVLLLTFF